ncbi:DUF6215 domain-containing protein [Streptomyces sp. NPDC047085]|uniref:DUF6215 domain-containing protein n=1 Tax=Streptomyces sp. NPDC047085 TaxID=3155140 RepID=UPI0033D6C9C6
MVVDSASERRHRPGVQAVAAVVAVVGTLGGLWALDEVQGSSVDTGPATCSPSHDKRVSKRVSAQRLCTALNRADLPALLGVPQEQAETAYGSESEIVGADGSKTPTPQAQVDTKTYSVKLEATEDDLPVSDMAGLLGPSAQSKKVLGHPAVLYSDHTLAFNLNLGSGKAGNVGTGGVAHHLLVAADRKDGGRSFEIAIWRQDDVTPDEAALYRIAERVLPTVPGWKAG